ncbi:MAG: tetratricopeptide (TPR) repeat protein/tRNA A-37 threonylcarbamoyl transferase component Bud32 [Myxococcota bacterium]|jgi:tetratricopeptide (TPR) repeat protein/tRNA A-37 threonylcarbamoyl transferase component Bud32
MATVFRCVDTRNGDEVAVKLLLPLPLADEGRGRFRREFRALSRLEHPNVLRVFEAGLWGDRPWFSMELVEGHDLRDELAGLGALPAAARFERIESIVVQVARALAYVHERGLVHRDITPGNIMIDGGDRVRLMDFGVVKELGADHTMVNTVIGTVAYMAPEQISNAPIDARADLYALGAVLYLMLTGRRPFNAHTIHGYMEKHLNSVPRPPHQLDPLVPARLDSACMRLLEKDPSDRFASAAHLLHVLGRAGHDDDGLQWPPRTVGRTLLKATLREALDALETGRRGSAVLLSASMGQGKTRILELVDTWARRRGLRVAVGKCRPLDRPFGAFANIYRTLGEDPPTQVLVDAFDGVEETRRTERYPVIAAFRDLLLDRTPVVLLLDDLHHADPATVELLIYLIRNTLEMGDAPVLFVLGHSNTETAIRRRIGEIEVVQNADLGPLEAAEVEELVLSLIDNTPASLALAERLHHESGGSPAFITDMLQGLMDDGVIVRGEDRFTLSLDVSEITRSRLPMPASLRQALQDRLAPLSVDAREVGRMLALTRRRVLLDVLIEACPFDEDRVMEALDELVDAKIVKEERDDDAERVELSHGRFRDVMLEQLEPDDVVARHRRMGEVLELHFRGRLGQVYEELAWHFEQAEIATKAYAYLNKTAARYLARSLYAESLTFLDRALQLEPGARPLLVLDDADRSLAEAHLARGQALFHLGRLDEAVANLRETERLARDLRDARLQARVAGDLGELLRNMGSHQHDAEHYLRQAIERAEESGDQTLLPNPMYQLGGVLWSNGDLEGAERNWRRSLEIATRVGDERSVGLGYNGLGILAICRGDSMAARKHIEQSAAVFERLGMLDRLAISRVNLIELYLQQGLLHKALMLCDRTVEQAREVQHVHGVALGLAWRAQTLAAIGRFADALSNAEQALALVRRLDAREDEVLALATIVRVRLATQEYDEALTTLAELTPLLGAHDHEGIAPQVRAWQATALAAKGKIQDARAVLDHTEPGDPWPHMKVRTDLELGHAYRALELIEPARAALARGLSLAEANGYRYYQLLAHHRLAGVVTDEAARARHQRVSLALARSLAANLPKSDSVAFMALQWGGG